MSVSMRIVAFVATLGFACVGAACDASAHDASRTDDANGTQDSLAVQREVSASLSGEAAPGAQSYSYRGMYAGMTRARLEQTTNTPAAADTVCHPSADKIPLLTCTYGAVLDADSAHVTVEAQFSPAAPGSPETVRVITVTRELPLDVDGVRLAHLLADAFEAQTALLDKRDASYGHHTAQVRMGTLNGTRQNFVDLAVLAKSGREQLTVKLSRSDPIIRRASPTDKPPLAAKH